jgi:peptidoglycan/xylan/chitin deacetylase (PgdA/CDA1 family)
MSVAMPASVSASPVNASLKPCVDARPRLPEPGRCWRTPILAGIGLAHVAGLALVLSGWWLVALALVVASHLVFFWGAIVPGSRFYASPVERFHTQAREVWLTIDDGPSADTGRILDLLDAHAAKATFFLVAERAAQQPQFVREILSRGHAIGNHTYSHPAATFWRLPPRAMRREIGRAQDTFERMTGTRPRLFRSVAGMTNPFVLPVLQQEGLRQIGWSARGFDAVIADPETVLARIKSKLAPGAIVLLHEGSAHGVNVEIIRRVLELLGAQGFRCVSPDLRLSDPRSM